MVFSTPNTRRQCLRFLPFLRMHFRETVPASNDHKQCSRRFSLVKHSIQIGSYSHFSPHPIKSLPYQAPKSGNDISLPNQTIVAYLNYTHCKTTQRPRRERIFLSPPSSESQSPPRKKAPPSADRETRARIPTHTTPLPPPVAFNNSDCFDDLEYQPPTNPILVSDGKTPEPHGALTSKIPAYIVYSS